MTAFDFTEKHLAGLASIGACMVATVLLWFGKISDVIWWSVLGTLLVPMIAGTTIVKYKAMTEGVSPP